MAGLLRRLLGRTGKPAPSAGAAGAPGPAPATAPEPEPEAGQRIDAARQRLKASIPPPEEELPTATEDAAP